MSPCPKTNGRPALTKLLYSLAGVALLVSSGLSEAATIKYQAVNLPDAQVGQDLWRFDYTVSGPMATFESLNLLFAAPQFASLTLQSNSAPSSLDPLLSQPDVGLATDGQLVLTALHALDNSFNASLSLQFVWTGNGQPGAQPFEWLSPDFDVIATGQTVPATTVPEASASLMSLLGVGVALAAVGRRRKAGC